MPSPTPGIYKTDLNDQSFVYFKGFQSFCFAGVLLWIFSPAFLAMTVLSIVDGSWIGVLIFLVFFVAWVLMFGRRLFYFGISDEYLAVRLQNFPRIKRNFLLKDIKEVVIEEHYMMPRALRIITADFEGKAYPGASLWGKHWRHLTEELKKKGIKVSNEEAAYRPGIFSTWDNWELFK